MNIAIFTNNYLPNTGGVTTYISTLKKFLEKKGHRVYIFAPKYNGYVDKEDNVYRLPSIRSGAYKGFNLPIATKRMILRKFLALDIDVIHVQHPFLLGELGLRIGKKYNIPVVFTYHTKYEDYSHYVSIRNVKNNGEKIIKEIILGATKHFCDLCDAIIVPSTHIQNTLIARKIHTRIEHITSGINLEPYKRIMKNSFRKKFHIADSIRIISYVGRLAEEKNLEFLMKCALEILNKDNNIICVFAGSGKKMAMLKAEARKNKMRHRFIFTGNLDKKSVIELYKDTDLLLFSSKTETQGLVIIEAMAGGAPVVAVDTAAIKDVLENNYNGILVKENKNAFSNAVLDLLHNKKRLEKYSRNALKTAQCFSAKKSVEQTIQLYLTLRTHSEKKYDHLNPKYIFKSIDWKKHFNI